MYKSFLLMLVSLTLMACFPAPPDGGGGGGGGTPDAAPPADPCTLITAAGNATPGFPYDVTDFNTNILPRLQAGCEIGSSCHGAGSAAILFKVFSAANPGNNCPEVETFNEVVERSSYANGGAMSDIVKKIDGTLTHLSPATSPSSMEMTPLLTAFIDTAKQTFAEGGGGGNDGGPGGGGGSFDPTVYANQIHPILTGSSCASSNCHNIEDGTNLGGGFGLHPRALAGSAEVTENIAAIAMRIDASLPASQATMTEFYDRCTDSHTGSVVGNPQAIEDWIAAGLTAAAIQ